MSITEYPQMINDGENGTACLNSIPILPTFALKAMPLNVMGLKDNAASVLDNLILNGIKLEQKNIFN